MQKYIRRGFALLLALIVVLGACAMAEAGEPAETAKPVTLEPGMRGEDVESLNARLTVLGYLEGELSEEYGADTEAAVRAFQSAAGLDVTGAADEATRQALLAEDAPVNPDNPPAGEMVWITRTGEKYHDNWRCSGMQYRTCVTVEEAAAQGFDSCDICFPERASD